MDLGIKIRKNVGGNHTNCELIATFCKNTGQLNFVIEGQLETRWKLVGSSLGTRWKPMIIIENYTSSQKTLKAPTLSILTWFNNEETHVEYTNMV